MSTARSPQGVPDLVTSLYGVVVAVTAALLGMAGHHLAAGVSPLSAGGGPVFPGTRPLLMLLSACAGVGVLTALAARRRAAGPVVVAGMAVAQLLTHLVMSSAGAGAGHPGGHLQHVTGTTTALSATQPSGAAGGLLAEPVMPLAHAAAGLLAVATTLAAGRMLAWVGARLLPPRPAGGWLPRASYVPVPRPRTPVVRGVASLTPGGVRAPPRLS